MARRTPGRGEVEGGGIVLLSLAVAAVFLLPLPVGGCCCCCRMLWVCLLYAAIAAAAPAGPHCSRGAEGREGGEVDACLCLCGWLCTVVNRCEHNDCQTRQLHKQCQCCPRSSKNKAATCMRAMVHLDVCSFLVLFLPSVLMQAAAAAAAASGPSSFLRTSRYWCHSSIWLFAPPPHGGDASHALH